MDERSKALRDKYLDDPIVSLEKPFKDFRGAIIQIVDEKILLRPNFARKRKESHLMDQWENKIQSGHIHE